MRFRVHDGACDALLPGAVGTLAGHPGGLGSPLTCGCGDADCPHPTPKPVPAPEGAGDDAAAEPPRIGHLWLDFAEDQLTEHKRAERGTLPVPEPERVVCPTCDSTGLLYFKVPTEVAPEGNAEGAPAHYPPPADREGERTGAISPLPPGAMVDERADDDTAEFEVVAEPSEEGAPSWPEVEPGYIEVVCEHCRGTGWAPPPPPPMIPNNPLPFRAGVRADLVDVVDAVGGYGA